MTITLGKLEIGKSDVRFDVQKVHRKKSHESDMHEKLFQAFNPLVPLSPPQREELRRVTYLTELPKGSLLLERGQICNHMHFILEGVVRAVDYSSGKEITPWFGFEGDIINAHLSFSHRKPSEKSIILVSDCKFLTITYESLQYLYSRDMVWQNLSRMFLEHYYIDLQERLTSFMALSAYERYEQLLRKYPDIEERVNLGYIASYLGIQQETLSNLRKRRKRQRLKRDGINSFERTQQ